MFLYYILGDDIANKFSNVGVTSVQEKGNCVKAQKG